MTKAANDDGADSGRVAKDVHVAVGGKSKLKSALAWAGKNPSPETDLGALLARVKPDASTATKRAKKAKSSNRAKRTGYGNGQSPGWD